MNFSKRLLNFAVKNIDENSLGLNNKFVELNNKLVNLEVRLKFSENECSELRQIVRFLQTDSDAWNNYMAQTRESFDTQWDLLPEGKGLVTDEDFLEQAVSFLEQYTALPRAWFKNRKILDAGCGNGRWSYILSSLGASVTALDQSLHGLNSAKRLCSAFNNFNAVHANLLEPLPKSLGSFDMVWSFGVLHHTGNTYLAFKHLIPFVKKGGIIFLMLYGEPSQQGEYAEVNDYVFHRRQISGMNFKEKIEYCKKNFLPELVHGWFDAISPRVNDLYRFDEVRDWLLMAGFVDVKRTYNSRNIFITALKE